MIETVFRTVDFPPEDRFERWREWVGRTHSPVELTSDHAADFRAHKRILLLGEVTVWPATVQPLVSRRTAKMVRRSDPDTYNLTLILKGAVGASWGRRDADYRPYDLHSQNSSQPCTVRVGRNAQAVAFVGVEMPKDLLALPRRSADRAVDHPWRPAAKAHAGAPGILDPLGKPDVAADTGHRPREVLDHPVGLGMIQVEPVQLAVADYIDARLLLGCEHDARCVGQRLLGRRCGKPVRNRIRTYHRRADARSFHGGRL